MRCIPTPLRLERDRAFFIGTELEAGYRAMAEDEACEAEALEWAEAAIGDVADPAR